MSYRANAADMEAVECPQMELAIGVRPRGPAPLPSPPPPASDSQRRHQLQGHRPTAKDVLRTLAVFFFFSFFFLV